MDLHDFKDVAENYDRYLEVMYTTGLNKHENFQEFYLELAKRYGQGGTVDIACGTGAVLLYLAERGIEVDGTDLSEEMCKVAGKKAKEMGLDLNIYPSDMTKFSSGRKYSLAIIARSGFMHLPTQELQIAALKNIREQLLPGGILTFNTFDPLPSIQAWQMNNTPDGYVKRLEYINCNGNREEIYNGLSYNFIKQQLYGNWKFVEYNDKGEVIDERVRPLLMRNTYRSEVFLLAQLCGFEVLDIYRGYKGDKEDLNDPDSALKYQSNLIWILRRKDEEDVIRPMSIEEIPECVKVIRDSFKTVADDLGFTEENAPRFAAFATDEGRLKYQFLVERRPMYVLLREGKIAGYYSLAFLEEGGAELNNLAVLPGYRHMGLGRKLLEDCFSKLRMYEINKLRIGIVEENQVLRKWYEKNGFVHIGTHKFDFFPFTCGYMEKDI